MKPKLILGLALVLCSGCASKEREMGIVLKPVNNSVTNSPTSETTEQLHIFHATECGYLETVKLLLKNNPGLLKSKDAGGNTLLRMAALFGEQDIVKLLLGISAKVLKLNI